MLTSMIKVCHDYKVLSPSRTTDYKLTSSREVIPKSLLALLTPSISGPIAIYSSSE